jgi:sugar-specific transcriptional regulator TrmB
MLDQFKLRKFLEELGLNDTQISIYHFLLFKRVSIIQEIKEALNLSYAQVSNNLNALEELGLIASSESRPKRYWKINPKITLSRLIDKKISKYNTFLDKIQDRIRIEESRQGVCQKQVYHYHYDDLSLALEKHYELISNAQEEIILSTLPPFYLKQIEPFLRESFKRGVKIILYFSNSDYQSSLNYLDQVAEIFQRLRITLIETEEKLCHNIIYNNRVINNGHILIDDGYFNSVSFKQDEIFFCDGFYGKSLVEQLKKMFSIKTVKKKLEIKYPESYQRVMDVIERNGSIKTRDISLETGISGKKLKEILHFLMNENQIVEDIDDSGVGRPGYYYSIVH